ncbi:GtrA family protein [Modestobacter sp. VKM Ac-2984]|uniref:GtrA family protein n=1 Tax=Modestobacter sp. VKM Ac-2984 TaxID=3004138 RepID=UPI0022AA798A|nr:GtrA family protein [Modestobacter sp. VKM Ac-2984]MCZ2816324.1 GtrA family protein [Modestobacter sp. VKM Ac-2984]
MTDTSDQRTTTRGNGSPARRAVERLVHRAGRDDGAGQFLRFLAVGGLANVLYALAFLLTAEAGAQVANLVGAFVSSVVANELHRRRTFRAGGRVSWHAAQWEGGGLALGGMVATSVALGWVDTVAPGSGAVTQLATVALVTGVIGLGRFVALRWAFGARTPRCA